MFTNQCSKCGEVFETKNPKRVICPNCLYPEGTVGAGSRVTESAPNYGGQRPYAPAGGYSQQRQPGYGPPQGGFQQRQPGYGPPQGGFQQRQPGYGPPQGGFQQRQPGYGPPRPQGGFQQRQPGYGPPRPQGGFQQRQGGFGPPRPQFGKRPGGFGPPRGGARAPKKLLVTKEQLLEIEKLYKQALPLPNPDIHEVIGQQIDLVPSKVFFGINLVREKMKLPKLEYPKRKLAVTPEQLMAIETLYEPYLPLPPLGIHKIISKQLRMDEWRVHVAIGLIRKNRNLARWNEERDDLPQEMRESQLKLRQAKEAEQLEKKAAAEKAAAEQKKEKALTKALASSNAEEKTEPGQIPESGTINPE